MLRPFFRRSGRVGAEAAAVADGKPQLEGDARPRPDSYGYFDQAYFQDGEKRGTAYRDYQSSSRSSLLYAEIAEACAALKPRRALEIGCATGVIVGRLNGMGVEAHGVDVSAWAIENREHPHVVQAGAERLPFDDGAFDLVYSVHALEHLPKAVADAAFAEIARVSAPEAAQFHTLPILGSGPYGGDRAATVEALKKDPTHNLLHDEAWWLARFDAIGFADVGARMLFQHEDRPDLSLSQLLLARPEDAERRRSQARVWNEAVIRRFAAAALSARTGIHRPLISAQSPWLDLPGSWADIEASADFDLDDDLVLTATVALDAVVSTTLRFCFLSGSGDESDLIRTFEPGVTTFQFKRRDLLQRLGSAGPVRRVVFGGEGRGRVRASLVAARAGVPVFSM